MSGYVVCSRKITLTPRALARALEAQLVRYPRKRLAVRPEPFQWSRDVFTFYPSEGLQFADDESARRFQATWEFARKDKYAQRLAMIGAELPAVPVFGPGENCVGDYVIRPLRHRARQGFQRTRENERDNAFTVGAGHYASPWLEIEKEFRTYFVRGKPVLTMFKANFNNPEGEQEAWSATRLDRLKLNDKLSAFSPLANASLAGVDIAKTRDGKAVIFECNFAPGLGTNNLERIINALKAE